MDQSNNFITLYNHDNNNNLDVRNPSEISFLEGATFTPIITFPSPTKIRFEWTNNRGLPNPEPMEFDIPMGNGDMVKAIYDTDGNGVIDNAENALKVNNFDILRTVLADEYTNKQIDEIINNLPKTTGDMEKSVYDTNNNGIVDNAEALMGHSYDEIKKMIDDAYYQRYATVSYKDTTIHANNSLKRNLVDENTKIEVLGQTIQNLVDDSNIWRTEQTVSTESASNVTLSACGKEYFTKSALKPSTKYTVFFDYEIKNNTLENYYFQCNQAISGVTQTSVFIFNKNDIDNNTKLKTFTTSNAFSGLFQIFFGGRKGSATFKNNGFMILEGDWTNKEISFVPFGLNYPETTEVVANSTQLLSKDDLETNISNPLNGIKYTMNADGSVTAKGTATSVSTMYYKNIIDKLEDGTTYQYNSDTTYSLIHIAFNDGTPDDYRSKVTVDKKRMKLIKPYIQIKSTEGAIDKTLYPMLNEGSTFKPWEPYTERKVNINYPLASVSDTIRDRYYVKDGKKYYEQNVEYYDYDDSWVILAVNIYTNTVNALLRIPNMVYSKENIGYSICNIIAKYAYVNTDDEHFYSRTNGYSLYIDKSKLSGTTKEDIKNWLRNNKAQFIAKLETPITTEIETEDWYSFDGQTNITTTNTVKPTLDIDIPSDLHAVVSNLMVENISLKQENQALTSELENQKAANEENTLLMNMILEVE